jgi:hypothetical protein
MNPRFDNPLPVLLVIRDGINEWHSLCRHFGIDPRRPATTHGILMETLLTLSDAGVIELNRSPENVWQGVAVDSLTFKISERWMEIQSKLGISLKAIAQFSEGSMLVKPFFGPPDEANVTDVFVMMPFRRELQPVYEDHVSVVANSLKLKVRRADDFFGAHSIMKDIWNAIIGSKICIADCTGRNPNVFYEIGIAHTVGRPVVLIAQKAEDVPFDLRHVRYVLYELTPRGMKKFEETLRSTLVEELGLDTKLG